MIIYLRVNIPYIYYLLEFLGIRVLCILLTLISLSMYLIIILYMYVSTPHPTRTPCTGQLQIDVFPSQEQSVFTYCVVGLLSLGSMMLLDWFYDIELFHEICMFIHL